MAAAALGRAEEGEAEPQQVLGAAGGHKLMARTPPPRHTLSSYSLYRVRDHCILNFQI